MECRAVVIEADARKALVRVARVNCAECGRCGLLARSREHTMEFTAANRLGVRRGDEVLLEVPTGRLTTAYLIVFGLPVLAMAAGYLIGFVLLGLFMESPQGPAVIAAVAAGLVAFWGGVKLAERRGLTPSIVAIVPAEGEGNESGKVERAEDGTGGGEAP